MLIKPTFVQAPKVKVLFNIGAGFDIPTGDYLRGIHGESILNGGLGLLTGVVGIGNNFKSTIMHYMTLAAASRIAETMDTSISTYDTEININHERLYRFSLNFPAFANRNILDDETWMITDKTMMYAEGFHESMREYIAAKKKEYSGKQWKTPFIDRDGKHLTIIPPSFGQIDSFTEFETSAVNNIQTSNELGDSGANTIYMKQGNDKTRFLMELPTLLGGGSHFMCMTAHIGKKIEMASGPVPKPPEKTLQYLKNGDVIKGATGKFFFLMTNCWHSFNAAPLINQGTKGPEYPEDPDDNKPLDTDLNLVQLRNLRGKFGPSGFTHPVIVSQTAGVLPSLTEFHLIKEADRFGISGTMQHYALDLYPDCKLSRTTVRGKLDNDPMLRRAMNITSELCQMLIYWRGDKLPEDLVCTPKELYDDLKAAGYDWGILLKTRGWWTINNDDHPVPFLSTMDLLRMRKGLYHPYWMDENKLPKTK